MDGEFRGEADVVSEEGDVGSKCLSLREFVESSEDEGCDLATVDGELGGFGLGDGEPLVEVGLWEFVVGGDGVGDEDAAGASREFGADERGEVVGVVEACVDASEALASVEGGEEVGAEPDDGDGEGFEEFASSFDIEERLDARGDEGDGEACEGVEVGGEVEAVGEAAVEPADATCGGEAEARAGGEFEGGTDGGGGVGSGVEEDAEVGGVGFVDGGGGEELIELIVGEPDDG